MVSPLVPQATTARFRQRKISLKQRLRVLWQKDIPDMDEDSQRDIFSVETGVEKGEEEEHHLQAVLNAQSAMSAPDVYIPTPSASIRWPEYDKYYRKGWVESSSYIRMSATVEDAAGCPYNMDERDDAFLQKMNSNVSEKCTEDEFEMIAYFFETVVERQQPFLTTDPSQVLDYDELEAAVVADVERTEKDTTSPERLLDQTSIVFTRKYKPNPSRPVNMSLKLFGRQIYNHWRERKIERAGKPIFATLKFEGSAEKDDNDPYVCFRHREVRQTRKTRRTDQQSSERLRRLKSEMEQGLALYQMVVKRETLRRKSLQSDLEVFELRSRLKAIKRKHGISGEEEELFTQNKRKEEAKARVAAQKKAEEKETTAAAAASSTGPAGQRGAGAGGQSGTGSLKVGPSKIPDLEMRTLEQYFAERENAKRIYIEAELRERAMADRGWVNYTENPFVPYCDFFNPDVDRYEQDLASDRQRDKEQARYSSLESPFPPTTASRLPLPLGQRFGASYTSLLQVQPEVVWATSGANGGVDILKHLAYEDIDKSANLSVPRFSLASYRKRVDRRGLTFVDRRGLIRKPRELEHPQTPGEERLVDRFRFDTENSVETVQNSFGLPARLNGVSEETQTIQFSSSLMAKSYEAYQEAHYHRQQLLKSAQQRFAARRRELQATAASSATSNVPNGAPTGAPTVVPNGASSAAHNGASNGTAPAANGTPKLQGTPSPATKTWQVSNGNDSMLASMSPMSRHSVPKVETSV